MTVSYSQDVQPIWDRYCNNCHISQSPRLLFETSGELLSKSWFKCAQGIERAPFVVPGNPSASFLMYKLTGENPAQFWNQEACDRLMPADRNRGGTPLIKIDQEATEVIRRWISELREQTSFLTGMTAAMAALGRALH